MNKCLYCKNDTSNPKFCSKSCAASVNNKIAKRKLRKIFCKNCRVEIPRRDKNDTRILCAKCGYKRTAEYLNSQQTIKDVKYLPQRGSIYNKIRTRARSTKKAKTIKSCENCGYDKHVEVCHVKPISSYSEDTLISIVNSDDNLIILCPNCHWELDHNLLLV